jgi:hypothetical protein
MLRGGGARTGSLNLKIYRSNPRLFLSRQKTSGDEAHRSIEQGWYGCRVGSREAASLANVFVGRACDDDLWPVTCINCGHEEPIEVRHLKATTDFTCPRCGRTFEFLTDTFINTLEQARASVRTVQATTVLVMKKR